MTELFLEPNITTSNSAYREVYLHKRENKLHHNTDPQKVKTEARNGSDGRFRPRPCKAGSVESLLPHACHCFWRQGVSPIS